MNDNSCFRKTKIVCTLGPACDNDEVVRGLIRAGMNVARFNFSHGSHPEHLGRIERVRRISGELNRSVALMLDTKGPEIRTGLVEGDGLVAFHKGDRVILSADGALTRPCGPSGEPGQISLSWTDAPKRIKPGMKILIADGLFGLEVQEGPPTGDGKALSCVALNDAVIGSRKNVNLLGMHAGLPIIGDQDKADLTFGAEQNLDFIAASFLCFPQEITEIRDFIRPLKWKARIIAKIESPEGLKNIPGIVQQADGVMVARGDLAVQIPDEQIPLAQKRIISMARRHAKPVITATQMLDSMIKNPRPTRAELTDVANAIFDGTDAVMLSGETANGAYPVESVETMAKIALTVEQSPEYRSSIQETLSFPLPQGAQGFSEVARVISRGAYDIALSLGARVILTPTLSGLTVRQIAMWRPEQPILAVTPDETTYRTLQLVWGVIPKLTKTALHSDEMIENSLQILAETNLAKISDKIVLAAGLPLRSPLPLNTVRILIMGNVLVRSASGGSASPGAFRTSGRILHARTAPEAILALETGGGDILVCPALTEDFKSLLPQVKGVICEGNSRIAEEELARINPHLVWLEGVHDALQRLEPGLLVTIDAQALFVYEGVV